MGQPEFREIMQRPEMRQLKQRIIASYHLGPLDRAETQAYVEHRLRHVGWREDPAFDEAAFDGIFAHSGGVPRRINTLCDRTLLAAFLGEQHRVTAEQVEEAAAELGEETGLQDVPPGVAAIAPGPASAYPLQLEPQTADRIAQLEDRVALLEASTSMTYGMLKKVLAALRERNKRRVADEEPSE